jgi:hypothetical protein
VATLRGLVIGAAVVVMLFGGIPLLYVYGPLLLLAAVLLLPGFVAIISIVAAVLNPDDRAAFVALAVVMTAISIWLVGSLAAAWE